MKPVWRKTIAVLEVIGGVCGSAAVAYQLTQRHHVPEELGLAAVLISIYLFAFFAGIMLWRDIRGGREASIVAQLFQLTKVLSPKLTFMVSYGLDFAPMVLSSPGPSGYSLSFDLRLFAWPILMVGAEWLPRGFGLSIVSLLALRLLLRPVGARLPAASRLVQLASPQPTQASEHPEWVPSFGFKVIVALIAVIATIIAVCAGAPLLVK